MQSQTLLITTAQFDSTCPACGGQVSTGQPISRTDPKGRFVCQRCTLPALGTVLSQVDPLHQVLQELLLEYRIEQLAGVQLRPAVVRRDPGGELDWSFVDERRDPGPVVLTTEPAGNCLKVTTFVPLQGFTVATEGDEQ
jgi:hypothetical protein